MKKTHMTGFIKKSIEVDGVRLNIHSGGSGETVYLLIHGIGASHRYFIPLARRLAKHATVHMLDMPGFGNTPKPAAEHSIPDFAGVVLRALQQQRIGPAIIVGHSMGSQVAVEMARQQPDAASSVVLLGPTAEDGARTLRHQAMRLMRNATRASFKSQLVVGFDYLRCGPVWFRKTLPALLAYETEKHVATLQAPLLVVAGQQDPVAPERWLQKLADSCSDGRVGRVSGEPHAVMYTDPSAVARLCLHMQQPSAASSHLTSIDRAVSSCT